MKHIQTFETFVNEGIKGLEYWKDYAEEHPTAEKWMNEPCTDMSKVLKCIGKSIATWNKESEEGPISKSAEQHIVDLAIQYYKQFKTINGNIITAMIMQES